MKTSGEVALVAPCGIHCGDCAAYKVKDDPSLEEVLARSEKWNGVSCPGCRAVGGNCQFVDGICETYACVTGSGLDFCFACAEFPCAKLNPAADRADVLPHNLKVFSLCYIKEQGLAKWLKKYPEIKDRIIPQIYFMDEYIKVEYLGYRNIIYTLYRSNNTLEEIVDFAEHNKLLAVTMPAVVAKTELPQRLKEIGVFTYAHTINDIKSKEILEGYGINGFYTDDLKPNND